MIRKKKGEDEKRIQAPREGGGETEKMAAEPSKLVTRTVPAAEPSEQVGGLLSE